MTGPLYPRAGNNANLIGKLIPHFIAAGHEVHLFSAAFGEDERKLPRECFGVPVHWAVDQKRDWKRKLLYPAISKVADPDGFSDALQVQILLRELKDVCKKYPFEAALSTSEPYTMACTAAQLSGGKNALYIMDPPARISNGIETAYRNRVLPSVLRKQSSLITTPFILEALKANLLPLPSLVASVGFPMITENAPDRKQKADAKFRLLFCGWLYSDIRSPRYFLDIVSRLDERFEVTFMGRECEKLQERFSVETKAKLITLPNQPYDLALQAMADADVLINIGNSVPVHMPSKTLEYINTGKPMVNFYKFADCPTLYYTKRYPLALNLFEGEKDMDAAAAQFVRFCEENIGKTIDHDWIETEYADCTPRFIAQKILESLEK
jgi:hypothetical protein